MLNRRKLLAGASALAAMPGASQALTPAQQLLLVGQSGGADPLAALGPTTWIKPGDLTLQYTTSGGTTRANVGDQVGLTKDKSGNGSNFSTATSANRPTLMLENGKYFLTGDGVNSKLAAASALIPTSVPFTILLVARYATTGVGPILAQYASAQAGRLGFNTNQFSSGSGLYGDFNPSINGASEAGGSTAAVIKSLTTGGSVIFAMALICAAGSKNSKVYLNNALVDSFTLSSVYNGVTELFGNTTIGNGCVKDLFELLIIPRAISSTEKDFAWGVLNSRYAPGLSLSRLNVATQQNYPDASNGDTGQGFTDTGLSPDLQDPTKIWCGNDGRNKFTGGNGLQLPSLVKLSKDGSTKIAEVLLSSVYPSMGTLQGVTEDATDNTLWIASTDENKIHNISKAGVDQAKDITKAGANGVAYDSLRNMLWYCTVTQIFRMNKTTGVVDLTITPGYAGLDHLFYEAATDRIWVTVDIASLPGRVLIFDAATGSRRKELELESATAIEGIYVDSGSTLYVNQDGYFHNLVPTKNQLQGYSLSGVPL